MSPQAISALPGAASTARTTTKSFNELSSEDFFGLLIAQLQSQDPLKPTDNQALLEQMSTIRQMEQSANLNKTLTQLSAEQRFGATAGLIGHYVAGSLRDSGGNNVSVEGLVIGVHFEPSGRAILELHNGALLPADKVTTVTLVENLPADLQQQLGVYTNSTNPPAPGESDTTDEPTPAAGAKPRIQRYKPDATYFVPEDGLVNNVLKSLFGSGASIGPSL
jgi:hypothetical protein